MFYAVGYLQILAVGLPFVAITCFVTAAFQSQGNTKTPMIIAGIVNVVNIALGWLLIFGNMGLPAMGLTGAGIALVGAQIVGALIGLLLLYHKRVGLFHGAEHGKKFSPWKRATSRIFTPPACPLPAKICCGSLLPSSSAG